MSHLVNINVSIEWNLIEVQVIYLSVIIESVSRMKHKYIEHGTISHPFFTLSIKLKQISQSKSRLSKFVWPLFFFFDILEIQGTMRPSF